MFVFPLPILLLYLLLPPIPPLPLPSRLFSLSFGKKFGRQGEEDSSPTLPVVKEGGISGELFMHVGRKWGSLLGEADIDMQIGVRRVMRAVQKR